MSESKKRSEWTPQETSALIEAWKDKVEELRTMKRHKKIHQRMEIELKLVGINKSVKEIQSKMKNLQSKYREEKKVIGPSGGSPSAWPYYDEIHALLGRLPVNDDSLVDEGLMAEPSTSSPSDIVELLEVDIDFQGDVDADPSTERRSKTRKRKIASIQEDLLLEIKRANNVSEQNERESNALLEKSNNIAERQVTLTEKFLEKLS